MSKKPTTVTSRKTYNPACRHRAGTTTFTKDCPNCGIFGDATDVRCDSCASDVDQRIYALQDALLTAFAHCSQEARARLMRSPDRRTAELIELRIAKELLGL